MAGRIREADVALVRDRSRLDDVIGEYVTLRRAGGGTLKGLCPFHDEKTPSFNVRAGHGTFHCFGCGEGGDVIAFVMKIEHLGFVEAVERLADRTGVQLTYEGGMPSAGRDRGTRTRMIDAHKAAAEFYAEQLEFAGSREGPRVPDGARLRRVDGPRVRLRLRAGRLGPADQTPVGQGIPARRAVQGAAVAGEQAGPAH